MTYRMHLKNGKIARSDTYSGNETSSRMMVASRSNKVIDQMAAPVPEIMYGSLYTNNFGAQSWREITSWGMQTEMNTTGLDQLSSTGVPQHTGVTLRVSRFTAGVWRTVKNKKRKVRNERIVKLNFVIAVYFS
jgi:hypothetical protein